MDVLHPRCCGLDVHNSSISACILLREAGRVQKHQCRFGAMTQDLHDLAEMATAVRCDSGSNGIQRRLLEASLEHSGGTVHGSLPGPGSRHCYGIITLTAVGGVAYDYRSRRRTTLSIRYLVGGATVMP